MKLSNHFKSEVMRRRASGQRQYEIAMAARVHPSDVSRLVNDALPIAENDPRVARLAAVLGLQPADCFEPDIVAQATSMRRGTRDRH